MRRIRTPDALDRNSDAIGGGNLLSVRASGPHAPGCSMSSHDETNEAVA
jgi:hypothetical protein